MPLVTRAFNIHLSYNARFLNKAGLLFLSELQSSDLEALYHFTEQGQAQIIISIQPMSNNNQLSVTIQNQNNKRLLHVQLDLYNQGFRVLGLLTQTQRRLNHQDGNVNKLIFLAAKMADALVEK